MTFQIKRAACAVTLLATLGVAAPAAAQISDDVVKIGFITDISGPYSDIDGSAGVEAVKMAIADFGGSVNGKKIEFVYADHQNKPDLAATKAREWFTQSPLTTGSSPASGIKRCRSVTPGC